LSAFLALIIYISSVDKKPWNCCEDWYDRGGSLRWWMHSLTQFCSVLSSVLFWKSITQESKHLNVMKV